jgi:hypothetical protein
MARPLSRTWLDFASVFRAATKASNGSNLARIGRSARWRKDMSIRGAQQRRGYLGQTQRRRATTSTETSFKHLVIDHHYESVVHWIKWKRSEADIFAALLSLVLVEQVYVLQSVWQSQAWRQQYVYQWAKGTSNHMTAMRSFTWNRVDPCTIYFVFLDIC